jgi:NADH:ubiquinone oxidoreductase subunit K
VTVDLVSVLFVAGGLIAAGAFVTAWRRELTGALAGVPVMLAGAGTAFAGISRFASREGAQLVGQEMAVLLAIVALASVALGVGLAGREGSR